MFIMRWVTCNIVNDVFYFFNVLFAQVSAIHFCHLKVKKMIISGLDCSLICTEWLVVALLHLNFLSWKKCKLFLKIVCLLQGSTLYIYICQGKRNIYIYVCVCVCMYCFFAPYLSLCIFLFLFTTLDPYDSSNHWYFLLYAIQFRILVGFSIKSLILKYIIIWSYWWSSSPKFVITQWFNYVKTPYSKFPKQRIMYCLFGSILYRCYDEH